MARARKPKKGQESAQVDTMIWDLCTCLAEWLDLTNPDRLPSNLEWQWIENKAAGLGYHFVFWQHFLRAQYLIGKLPRPVPNYPTLVQLAIMGVRGILSDFVDRFGLAERVRRELDRVSPVWDGGGVPDWSNAGLPEYLLLLTDSERDGMLLALQDLLNAYGERVSAQGKVEETTCTAESHQPEESPKTGRLDIPGRFIGAAYELKREGKPVTVKAAAERAGVDRTNLYHSYPELITMVKQIGGPDRALKRGQKNSKTGQIEAVHEDERE